MFRFSARSAILLATCGAVASAPSIVRRHEAAITDQMHRDLAAGFPAVGMIGPYPEQRTATLIAPGWILTAAHCATLAPIRFTPAGQTPIPVVQWFVNPHYRSGNLSNGFDIALGRLAAPVHGIEPMALYAGMDETGRAATIAGAGLTGTGLTGAVSGTGDVLRAGQNAVDFSPSWPNVLLSDFDNAAGTGNLFGSLGSSPAPMALEANVASGDSGGPLLIQQGGQWRVAGVISVRGPGGTNSQYNTFALYARVNTAANSPRDWINGILAAPGRVSFRVSLADMANWSWHTLFTIQLRHPGTTTAVQTINVRTDGYDSIGFTTSQRGTFDVAIKAQSHLRVVVRNVTITDGGAILPDVSLPHNGDCDNDNRIGLDDYLILASTYELSPMTDRRGDLNFDGACNITDFLILAANYDLAGEP
jgi:hypothetical protein